MVSLLHQDQMWEQFGEEQKVPAGAVPSCPQPPHELCFPSRGQLPLSLPRAVCVQGLRGRGEVVGTAAFPGGK